MKNLVLLLCFLLLFPLLGSCGITAPDRQVFAISMAIDLAENGGFVLTIQSPQGMPAGGEPAAASGGARGYAVYSAASGDLPHALHLLEASLPFPLNFSQLRLCFLSTGVLAEKNLESLALELLRFPSMRAQAVLLAVQGSAREALQAQRTTFSMRLSTHMDTMLQNLVAKGYLPQSSLGSVLQDLGSGRRDPLLGLGAVNGLLASQGEGSGGGEASQGAFSQSRPVLEDADTAGSTLLMGDNPVEMMGAAVTALGRVVGMLSPRECVIFHHLKTNGRFLCAIQEENLQLQIRLSQEDLNDTILREGRALLEKLQALGSDPFGFANVSAHSFWTNEEWEAYGFRERYPSADVYIGT
ncbi:MAG: hypothetical protein VB099_05405 [Candidatus Limiplasma sp.]|nr:hypothetical protein [Candidatus Limiplasma sp.]